MTYTTFNPPGGLDPATVIGQQTAEDMQTAIAANAQGVSDAKSAASAAQTSADSAGSAASAAQQTADSAASVAAAAIPAAKIGEKGGVAALDADGNVTAPVTGDISGANLSPDMTGAQAVAAIGAAQSAAATAQSTADTAKTNAATAQSAADAAQASATAAGTAASAAQATANAAIPSTQKGAANGVAALDASGNVTAPITGDASGATVVPTGSAAGTAGTKLADLAKTANGAVQSSQVGEAGGVVGLDANKRALQVQGFVKNPSVNFDVVNAAGTALSSLDGYGNFFINGSLSTAAVTFTVNTPSGAGFTVHDTGNVYYNSPTSAGVIGYFLPSIDNNSRLGAGSNRWAQLFAATATINTSDATEKTLASASSPFTLAQIKAALRSLQTRLYQWNDMILKKGEKVARYHVGYLAQDVQALLLAANIDPTKTALWCNDALTQSVQKTVTVPAVPAVTTTDPATGAVTVVTPEIPEHEETTYEDVPVLNPDGTQKYRQGLRMELVHAVLIDDSRDRITALESDYAALLARVAALESKASA